MTAKSIAVAAYAISAALFAASLEPAHADWWSKHIAPVGKGINKTFNSIVKNPGEILPVCWGHPQDCRAENMPGDAKTPPVKPSDRATSICVQPDGQGGAIAWFYPIRPAQYQQNAPVTVTNLQQCQERTISGPVMPANMLTIAPTGWTESVFSNGTTFWMLRGRIL
ncbi:hypothetical protein [Mesorhizobium sp. L2C084A000]|uniref:hypothetical protein n=1 Tax=unclassified Mesorhizobium TaxID=325217 RepID=UPI0003CFA079|nr:hypothetical protein [Mesorhizobium sp. L2C084A000]ESZ19999.1 hypothetical protein X734_31600 [Mesorhizobium sp. L2C084A000]